MIHDYSCPFSPIIVDKSVRISNRNTLCSTMLHPCDGTPLAGNPGQSWPGAANSCTTGGTVVVYHREPWAVGSDSLRGVECI